MLTFSTISYPRNFTVKKQILLLAKRHLDENMTWEENNIKELDQTEITIKIDREFISGSSFVWFTDECKEFARKHDVTVITYIGK